MAFTPLDEATRSHFRSVFRIAAQLRRIEPEMTMNQVIVFCWVALNEGRSQVDLRSGLEMTSSTSSRCLAALSPVHRLGKPGLNLIEWCENPEDRRAKLLYLSARGRELVLRMIEDLK